MPEKFWHIFVKTFCCTCTPISCCNNTINILVHFPILMLCLLEIMFLHILPSLLILPDWSWFFLDLVFTTIYSPPLVDLVGLLIPVILFVSIGSFSSDNSSNWIWCHHLTEMEYNTSSSEVAHDATGLLQACWGIPVVFILNKNKESQNIESKRG